MFAIYDTSDNSNGSIFATGATEAEAWETLQQWGAEEGNECVDCTSNGDWDCVPCSEAVHLSDGQTPWTLCADGVARLNREFVTPEDFCEAR